MITQEIKDLIASKIAGQGSAVDAGSALPQILNGIVDAIAEVSSNGYKFLGTCLVDEEQPTPDIIIPDDGNKYFVLAFNTDDNYYLIFTSNNGVWDDEQDGFFDWRVYNDAETIRNYADETDGYITPKGLVDYVASSDVLVLPTDDYTNVYGSYPTKAALAQQFGISESDVDGLLLGKYRIIKDNIDYSIWVYQGSVNKVAVFTTWVQDERKFIAIGSNNGTYYVSENV